ncbi:hypothetical protein BGX27_009972 [Mortierella sp. AM989]|nr:hypothetical protein BGX27_009972 [Mortierella sp. AM989]
MQDTHKSSPSHSAENAAFALKASNRNNNRPISLTDMPAEVLMQVALSLPCKEFTRFLQTNHTIYDIVNSHYIWHQRFVARFGQSILGSKLENAKNKDTAPPSRPPSPRFPPDFNTISSNNGSPNITTYHNHQDPVSSTSSASSVSSASSSGPSSPQLTHSQVPTSGESSSDSNDDEGDTTGSETAKIRSTKKGKEKKIDLRKTTEVSKELLIELYRQYSRMTLPAEDMIICHMGDRYWKMIESRSSSFGKIAQLQSVWWMDVVAVFRGVPPGRYKVQWRVKVTSEASIVNSEFRAIVYDKDEEAVPENTPDTILFKPRNIQEFTERTDTNVAKADRKPFRNLFRKDFTILELPGDLTIEDDFQNVFLQIRNHEGWKSGLCIDYARLVDLDDPEKSVHRVQFRNSDSSSPPNSGSEEEVNDEGEEYYPTSTPSRTVPWFQSTTSGVNPDLRINPLTFRSRAFRQYNAVENSAQLDVGARTPSPTSPSSPHYATASGDEAGSSAPSSPNSNNGNRIGSGSGSRSTSGIGSANQLDTNRRPMEDPDSWYKLYAILLSTTITPVLSLHILHIALSWDPHLLLEFVDMEKKRSGGKKNSGGSNSNRSNHAAAAAAAVTEKLNDTTSSLKNLQLGASPVSGSKGPGSTSANGNNVINNNNNKGGKKSKKNTSNGSSASTSTPAKKSTGPVLLGMPDSPMEHQDDTDPYITKIGGVPSWLDQDLPAPSKYGVCGACGKNMYLLLQAYVPLEKSPYDRTVYVWACNSRLCMRKNGSFRVIRALKMNAEYAQKLEKKPKPAAAPTPAAAPGAVAAANPFAAPGAFDMGNALFGGAGSGFNNPFAASSSTPNPFAPPPGFGVTSPTPAVKSFASVTSSNIPKEESGSESEEDEDTTPEPTDWPEKLPAFDPHYLYIAEEVLEKSNTIDDEISQRYGHLLALEEAAANDDEDENGAGGSGGATWSGEAYEKASLPKGVDKAFKKFTERVQSWPDQCVRYDFPGSPLLFSYSDRTAQTLLPPNTTKHSKLSTPSAHRIPKCPACKGPRGFEFQLMPNLLSMLDVTSKNYLSQEEKQSLKERKGAQVFDVGMEWGTILVYSCVEDCFGRKVQNEENNGDNQKKVKYFEEVALVQFED